MSKFIIAIITILLYGNLFSQTEFYIKPSQTVYNDIKCSEDFDINNDLIFNLITTPLGEQYRSQIDTVYFALEVSGVLNKAIEEMIRMQTQSFLSSNMGLVAGRVKLKNIDANYNQIFKFDANNFNWKLTLNTDILADYYEKTVALNFIKAKAYIHLKNGKILETTEVEVRFTIRISIIV